MRTDSGCQAEQVEVLRDSTGLIALVGFVHVAMCRNLLDCYKSQCSRYFSRHSAPSGYMIIALISKSIQSINKKMCIFSEAGNIKKLPEATGYYHCKFFL